MTGFEQATAVRPAGAGAYAATCHGEWSTPTGPNGGYLAAIVARAVLAEVADPAYALRSLTCHFLRPPQEGPVRLETEVVRRGRTVATLRARLLQDAQPCVEALAALSTAADAPAWEPPAPDAPPADAVEPLAPDERMYPIGRRLEIRPAFGAMPFSGADEATTGGWLRIREGSGTLDSPAVALLTDAWMPSAFARLTRPAVAPTIDLTIHFRRSSPPAGDQLLGIYRSRLCAEGLFEEDGELWDRDGRLVAQSRQLALLR